MGVCDFCGEKAGWLKDRHPACNERAEGLKKPLRELICDGTVDGKTFEGLEAKAKQVASDNKVPFTYFKEVLLQGANDAASRIAEHSPVSEGEMHRVVDILRGLGSDSCTAEFPQRRWFGMGALFMSYTLWEVIHGIAPYYDGLGRMQFNLHAGEYPVFSAGKVVFAEEKTVSTHNRSFASLSVPVGAGIYYRIGGSQDHQEKASGLVPMDVGEVLITNQALYFGGQKKTLRIALVDVIRYQPYVDGVGVCEAHRATKVFVPDYSGMDTGWFFFNLLSALTGKLSQ